MTYQRAWAEINLSHVSHNMAAVRALLPGSAKLMGVVKADAYGHGALPVAQTLLTGGADALGVAIYEEGAALREGGIGAPILVMGFTPEPLLPGVVHLGLTQTIFSLECAKELAAQAARQNKRAAVHIKIDTGMSRLGFLPNGEGIKAICEIAALPELDVQGIYTHLATSDQMENSFMTEQNLRFGWALKELAGRGLHIPIKHIANSGAFAQTLRDENNKEVFLDMARLGILLYGHPPSAEMAGTCAALGLKPAMRLMTQISMVKKLPAGAGISYGHLYKTTRPSVIAVLPVGYADGCPRRLSQGGQVLVDGKFAPIAGAICMDQCMIDITGIPGVKAGDTVTMLGDEPGITADCLAGTVGTISYEILCGIGKRVPRVYIS